MRRKKHRIAFAEIASDQWTAGAHYYNNLFCALRSLDKPARPEIVLLKSTETGYSASNAYIDEVIHEPKARHDFWGRQRGRLERKLGIEPTVGSLLRANKISSVFTCWRDCGPRFSVPLLGWIPDLQYFKMPELFTEEEIKVLDGNSRRVAANATRVVLSSQAALRDFEQLAPEAVPRARTLPFVSQVPANIYDADPGWICKEYQLPERFVYLPNQFWQHKNHRTAIEALAILKSAHPEITIACSGNTNDRRSPLHFGHLLAEVARLGLRNNFILLGWLPHGHMFQLMRQSLAVLQPSLFEGWSTTVEECKSLGKALIVSDIPIHREQRPEHALFFDPHQPEALAECLVRTYAQSNPGPDRALETEARAHLPARTRRFGNAFMEIVEEASEMNNEYSRAGNH